MDNGWGDGGTGEGLVEMEEGIERIIGDEKNKVK